MNKKIKLFFNLYYKKYTHLRQKKEYRYFCVFIFPKETLILDFGETRSLIKNKHPKKYYYIKVYE